jgi:hypothetical protein
VLRRPSWRQGVRAPLSASDANNVTPTDLRIRAREFHCFVTDPPCYLVPARLLAGIGDDDALIVNPALSCETRAIPRVFLRDPAPIWVRDPATELDAPLWFEGALGELMANLSPGHLPPALAPRIRALMASAGVLVSADGMRSRAAWERTRTLWSRGFRERGYAEVGSLLHPFLIGALRRYYRRLLRAGGMKLGDRGNPRRFVMHNDDVARFFQEQLVDTVAAIAGVPVKPSYVYIASYQPGAELPLHTDRAQCEYSISMLVDFTPEPIDRSPWPLHLETASGKVTIEQGLGDALIYRGRQLAHHRDRLPEAASSTSLLFHYVDRDFAGSLD